MKTLSKPMAHRRRRGFTLVELLVVVLIMAILMALALPLYLSAVANSERRTCRANMQTIANAVQAGRVKVLAPDYSSFISGGVNSTTLPDLPQIPLCPLGGSYTLANGSTGDAKSFKVICSITDHGSFEPGVDNN
ncbi:MAG TPA: prepilin-type N-terminal cleavage/methylation domain-containing protein [Chthonomonadaceae bacterium]|nr:prepilin-type N-terminal cleavage/methylation domain-containing protein [Chthonomonadaceae bacterium]